MGDFLAFLIHKECIKNVHKLISNVVSSFKGDGEKFYPTFYKCISDAENPFCGSLNKHTSLLLGFELANHVLTYLSGGSLDENARLSNLNIVLLISVTKKNQLCFL